MTQTVKISNDVLAAYDSECEDFEYFDWHAFCKKVEAELKKFAKSDKMFAYGLKLTWRKVAGYHTFTATKGENIVNAILPNTSKYRIELKKRNPLDKYLTFVISHHDAPTGETYWVMTQAHEKKIGVFEQHFEQHTRPY